MVKLYTQADIKEIMGRRKKTEVEKKKKPVNSEVRTLKTKATKKVVKDENYHITLSDDNVIDTVQHTTINFKHDFSRDLSKCNIKELFFALDDKHAIVRVDAAKRLHVLVSDDPVSYKKYIPNFIKALDNFEAQTRWEVLECLMCLVKVDPKSCSEAIEGAQRAMFEELNHVLTLNAYKFLAMLGASSVSNSKKVWPFIKDAITLFDGDLDYDKILLHTCLFAGGNISAPIKKELAEIVRFDAENTEGVIGYRAKCVLEFLKGKNRNLKNKVKAGTSKRKKDKSSKKE